MNTVLTDCQEDERYQQMRAKATAAILVLLPLLVLGLVACGTDSGAAASQVGETANDVQSVAIVDETHDDGDGHDVAITDEHDDGDGHDVAITDEHDDGDGHEVAITDEHDDGDGHDDVVLDTHDDEADESHAHADTNGPVNPDAPVMNVFANEFGYETDTTEVGAGLPFSIQIRNDGVLEHDITFAGLEDEFGIHVQPGESDIGTFSISETGEYVYYCTVPGHREAGMTGTLMVSEAHVAADEEADHVDEHDVLIIEELDEHDDDEEAQHGDDDHVEAAAGA